MIVRAALICACVLSVFSVPSVAGAWGLRGHEIIGRVATNHLAAELPAFVRTTAAKDEITYLQSEEDRLKIGEADEIAWTREWTTDHYIDIGDDGKIAGTLALHALPPTRDEYIQALMHASPPADAYKFGFVPYAILEGYEQVRSDFALWRIAARAGNATERRYRESLTIHDIGLFAHFVGDGSQPLHVSVHYNGWGRFPNPHGFSTDRHLHAQFEDTWVDRFMDVATVDAQFAQAQALSIIPLTEIEDYLLTSDSFVVPLYELERRGAFHLSGYGPGAHADAMRFTARRLAAASEMLDALVLTAWRTSDSLRQTD